MIAPERLESLQRDWVRLLAFFQIHPDAARQLFDRLVAVYSSPIRAYHNLEHLAEMFDVIESLAPVIDNAEAVRLAVWFHDAVYDTRAKDNEERSALLVGELLLPLGVPPGVVDRTAALVRATAHLSSSGQPADGDTGALLDADLAILAAPDERYLRYARDIRKEYDWVPELEYRRGRSEVLRAFLSRPRIYFHRIMFEGSEQRARCNIERELESLVSETGKFP